MWDRCPPWGGGGFTSQSLPLLVAKATGNLRRKPLIPHTVPAWCQRLWHPTRQLAAEVTPPQPPPAPGCSILVVQRKRDIIALPDDVIRVSSSSHHVLSVLYPPPPPPPAPGENRTVGIRAGGAFIGGSLLD